MSKTEEVEPYVPHSFKRMETYTGEAYWNYRYSNYKGEYPWSLFVRAQDELAAFIQALKYLNRLKLRADKRREKKEQTR